ncbi:MAG: FeoB-associated Cys-rich membrane protein [Oscillospiraceae bacterium]|nr:FeoB-associated Cys-rich membrane protein [Oscillospiraceae bacterium]
MNLPTILVGLVILLVVVAIIGGRLRRKGGGCSCGCGDCPSRNLCHPEK